MASSSSTTSTSESVYLSDILVRQRLLKADLDSLKRLIETQHTETMNLIRAQSASFATQFREQQDSTRNAVIGMTECLQILAMEFEHKSQLKPPAEEPVPELLVEPIFLTPAVPRKSTRRGAHFPSSLLGSYPGQGQQ